MSMTKFSGAGPIMAGLAATTEGVRDNPFAGLKKGDDIGGSPAKPAEQIGQTRWHEREGALYLIRDVFDGEPYKRGSRLLRCEYGTQGDDGVVAWTPCEEGVEFAAISPFAKQFAAPAKPAAPKPSPLVPGILQRDMDALQYINATRQLQQRQLSQPNPFAGWLPSQQTKNPPIGREQNPLNQQAQSIGSIGSLGATQQRQNAYGSFRPDKASDA